MKPFKIPKFAGKVTALVLSIDVDDPLAYIYGTVTNLQAIFISQSEWEWTFIDQIFLERKGNIEILIKK